ncbi:MAG: DUF3836 domain-containing protein, partial [Candidatus Aegiribacteria sp.]|nr:DUF3836 domain-containing protein [Candidatus Aegiribacteria sp.]
GIRIFERLDSIWQYEYEWMGNWDADSGKMIAFADYKRIADQAGNQLLYTMRRWKGEYGWEPYDSVWRDYDANSRLLFSDVYSWHYNLQAWTGERRSAYFRDGAGNDTLMIGSAWDWLTNDWRYGTKLRNRFDQENRNVEELYYEWNWNENIWIFLSGNQTEYILNASGEVETKNLYGLDLTDTTRYPASRTEYTYDDNGHMLKEEGYRLVEEEWVLNSREEWEYDNEGNMILHTPYQLDYPSDTLIHVSRYAFAYDSHGRRTLQELQLWDADIADWLPYSRYSFTYNANDALTLEDYERWDIPVDGAYSHRRTEYLYNTTGQDSVRIHYQWNESAQEIYLSWKEYFYYGEVDVQVSTGLNNIPAAEFTLYPIPVRDLLMIESEVPADRMDLLDLNGRIVYSSGRIEAGMDLSSLESGIYLVRLWDPDGSLLGTRKILKE